MVQESWSRKFMKYAIACVALVSLGYGLAKVSQKYTIVRKDRIPTVQEAPPKDMPPGASVVEKKKAVVPPPPTETKAREEY